MKKTEDVPLVEFMYLVFTGMPGESSCRWLWSLLLCLCDIFFWALINSLVCSFCMSTLGHACSVSDCTFVVVFFRNIYLYFLCCILFEAIIKWDILHSTSLTLLPIVMSGVRVHVRFGETGWPAHSGTWRTCKTTIWGAAAASSREGKVDEWDQVQDGAMSSLPSTSGKDRGVRMVVVMMLCVCVLSLIHIWRCRRWP